MPPAASKIAPPLMAPSRQPRCLLTVLKGISLSQSNGLLNKEKASLLPSEQARNQLSVISGAVTGKEITLGQMDDVNILAYKNSPLETAKFIKRINEE